MAAEHNAADRPAAALPHRVAEHLVAALGGRPIGKQVEAPAREERRIELRRIEETLEAQGAVACRPQGIKLGRGQDNVPPGA